jgi:uncharacterized membrane protein required for colicin V production
LNALDVVFLVVLIAAATGGWRKGIIARICTAFGLIGGVLLAARNAAWITSVLPLNSEDPGVVGVVIALMIGAVGGRIVGTLVGHWIKRRLPTRPLQSADRLVGAVAGGAGALVVVWLSGPFLGLIPGWPSTQWQGSRIASEVTTRLPAPPNPLGDARWAIGIARFPQLFATARQAAELLDAAGGLAPDGVPGLPGVGLAVAPVQRIVIETTACKVNSVGSGVVMVVPAIGPQALILTTAHQVAGASKLTVDDGRSVHVGEVVAIDVRKNLALLRVSGALIGQPAQLATQTAPGALRVSGQSISIATSVNAEGRDIYGKGGVTRSVLLVRGRVDTKDIGGAVLDESGLVHGVVVGLVPDRPGSAVVLRVAELRSFLTQAADFPRTSSCAKG